jgi:long-chain fatty acid transport protein
MHSRTLALLLAALPTSALALGFRITDHGAEATARGGAFVATADNPSAIYHNPAGITQLTGMQVLLNGYAIGLESTFDPSTPGADFDSKFTVQAVPDYFVTLQPSKDVPITLGWGSYAPFGFGIEYPDSAVFRSLGKKATIQFFTGNPVMAFKLTPELSVAIGATLNYSRAKLVRGIVSSGDAVQLEGSGFAVGVTAGVFWQPSEQHAFGVQYLGPISMHYSGHARTYTTGLKVEVSPGVEVQAVPKIDTDEDMDLKLNLPQTITAGYSFRPTPDWNFEFDIEWTDWDNLNSPTLHLQRNLDSPLVFNYESSFMYEFGITKKFAKGWSVSAGYIYSENSIPNEAFSPLVPDSNRHVMSIGVGRKYDHWNWYLAYQLSYGPHRTISRDPLAGEASFEGRSLADGSYRFQSHALSLTVGYVF